MSAARRSDRCHAIPFDCCDGRQHDDHK
jgi:hypothetical protein